MRALGPVRLATRAWRSRAKRSERVAALARLRLEPAEEERLTADLDHILDAFARLAAARHDRRRADRARRGLGAPLRDDEVTNPPAGDELLANAPARDGRFFRVPKIIE